MNQRAFSILCDDRPGLLRDLSAVIADQGGNIESVQLNRSQQVSLAIEVAGYADLGALLEAMRQVVGVQQVADHEPSSAIFGKRVIVFGGGAQIAQVVLGAVTEADRHNLRGERISVDTIPLVGEQNLAMAIRAVGRLPRARVLVLAGSLMGGDIADAVRELREEHGIPVISLNMAGSVPAACDLVVTDPVQAGTMAVMAIADTAKFDLARVRGRTF
ncbi:MAG: DUF5612 domain-containing protein [Fimbriimonas sp.]